MICKSSWDQTSQPQRLNLFHPTLLSKGNMETKCGADAEGHPETALPGMENLEMSTVGRGIRQET